MEFDPCTSAGTAATTPAGTKTFFVVRDLARSVLISLRLMLLCSVGTGMEYASDGWSTATAGL